MLRRSWFWAVAFLAAQTAPATEPAKNTQPPEAGKHAAAEQAVTDEEFLEFLANWDSEDETWTEYLASAAEEDRKWKRRRAKSAESKAGKDGKEPVMPARQVKDDE